MNGGGKNSGAYKGAELLLSGLRDCTDWDIDVVTDHVAHDLYRSSSRFFRQASSKIRTRLRANIIKKRFYSFDKTFFEWDIEKLNSDYSCVIVNWFQSGLISIDQLMGINIPIFFVVRDMWLITGGCHYTLECVQYKTQCVRCPALLKIENHCAAKEQQKKKTLIMKQNAHFIPISKWLYREMSNSICESHRIHLASNCIEIANSIPFLKKTKERKEKFTIGIGALNLNDYYKGLHLIRKLARYLDPAKIQFKSFGAYAPTAELATFSLEHCGLIHSFEAFYQDVDVFLSFSVQEAFGKTVAEAQNFSTPVVCLKGTGSAEIIIDGVTGLVIDANQLGTESKRLMEALTNWQFDSNAVHKNSLKYHPGRVALRYREIVERTIFSKK